MCGEKLQVLDSIDLRSGSPPHVRGKVRRDAGDSGFVGITPACAGKSWEKVIYWDTDRDHPRMCGEKWLARFKPFATRGSPPHVRGKGVVHILVPEPLGITPAYAGKSSCAMRAA